jgi:hypothetical protein
MANIAGTFFKKMKNPVFFRMFLLTKLPVAYFSGVRVKDIDEKACRVTVPYKWFTKNPFRSTYFASLSMAAEMSTGALAMAHLYKSDPPVSMLVLKVESEYFKKATARTSFICNDGDLFRNAVRQAISNNEPSVVRARSIGTNQEGEKVAEFYITWSFKARLRRPQPDKKIISA